MSSPLGTKHYSFPDMTVVVWDDVSGSTGILAYTDGASRWAKPSQVHPAMAPWDVRFRVVKPPLLKGAEYPIATLDAPAFREMMADFERVLGASLLLDVTKARNSARLIVGKRIEAVMLSPFKNGRGGHAFHPVLVLEDGASLAFRVQETDTHTNEYGVELVYEPPSKTGDVVHGPEVKL